MARVWKGLTASSLIPIHVRVSCIQWHQHTLTALFLPIDDDTQDVDLIVNALLNAGPGYYELGSPVPSLYSPTPGPFHVVPPVLRLPSFDQPRARQSKGRKPRSQLVVVPPPHPDIEYNVHRVLDGSTLCERKLPIPDDVDFDATPSADAHDQGEVQPGSVPEDNICAARSIIRPLSTPPAVSGVKKLERVRVLIVFTDSGSCSDRSLVSIAFRRGVPMKLAHTRHKLTICDAFVITNSFSSVTKFKLIFYCASQLISCFRPFYY